MGSRSGSALCGPGPPRTTTPSRRRCARTTPARAGAATPPFVTLQVLCGAALLFNGATLLHAAAGGCEGAGAATGAVVRFAAGLSTYTFRGGAALLALLMAHASCPERSMRARAEWVARAYRRGAAALAVVLVGSELTELVVSLVDAAAPGWRAPPPPPPPR